MGITQNLALASEGCWQLELQALLGHSKAETAFVACLSLSEGLQPEGRRGTPGMKAWAPRAPRSCCGLSKAVPGRGARALPGLF